MLWLERSQTALRGKTCEIQRVKSDALPEAVCYSPEIERRLPATQAAGQVLAVRSDCGLETCHWGEFERVIRGKQLNFESGSE